jgi:hypothetical protein
MAGFVVGSSAKREAGINVDAAVPAMSVENCLRFMRYGSAQHQPETGFAYKSVHPDQSVQYEIRTAPQYYLHRQRTTNYYGSASFGMVDEIAF